LVWGKDLQKFVYFSVGGGTGGGGQPPTRPPFVTKPTPASKPGFVKILKVPTPRPDASESDSEFTPEGTSDDGWDSDAPHTPVERFNHFRELETSLVDSCVANLGPRVHSSSSDIYPVNCPEIIDNRLPIHPSTHFIRSEQCTEAGLDAVLQRLAENQEAIVDATNELEILNNFMRIQQNSQANVFADVCKARIVNPNAPFLTVENVDRTKAMCVENIQRTANFVRHLECRLRSLRQTVNRDLAEQSAISFGRNYARHHPNEEFVIFLLEEGNVIQRTNPFHPSRFSPTEEPEEPAARVTLAPPNLDGPVRKKTPSKRPRDKRSNVLSNRLDSQVDSRVDSQVELHFDVMKIDHVFQMANLFHLKKNILIVFPDSAKIFQSLTKTMDNNLIILHDSVKTYYTSGRYEANLKMMTSDYFKFTNALERSSVDLDFKKHFILELNDFVRQKLGDQLKWFYNPYDSIEEVRTKILNVSQKMYSIKI